MTNSGTEDRVQAALTAFEAGEKSLADLEAVLNAALGSGLWTRTRMIAVLRNSAAATRIPAALFRRLDLDMDEEATAPRAVEAPIERVDSTATPAQNVTAGSLLAGRYRLERKLGEGGMGIVYLAHDQQVPGEVFAIKVLGPQIRQHPEALELLREEVRKTRALAHPNIVGVYSLNVDQGDVFILMEYLEGKTLQELLDEDFGRGMPLDRAWPIIQDLGAALAYAHDRSIIHGDLKPANVFVTTSGKTKLLDFGIARAARGARRDKDAAVRGALSPPWASCEMLEYQPPDTRDDIYALACMLYEMLSGRRPFGERNAVQARDAGEKPTFIAGLTKQQNAALARGLSFDRAMRTESVESLLAGLARPRSKPDVTRATLLVMIIIVVATLLGFLVYTRRSHTQASTDIAVDQPITMPKNAIAVLPFVSTSDSSDDGYFAEGVAEEVASLLAKIPGFRVIGTSSSFRVKREEQDLQFIGRQLHAAYLVQGTVRRQADRVRISAKLLDASTGLQRWSESYDRRLSDVFVVQDEIAMSVARALQLTVTNTLPERQPLKDEAYDLYLRGVRALDSGSDDSLKEAVADLQRVLELEPKFAPAALQLAQVYKGVGEMGVLPPKEAFERARAAATLALQLDKASGDAHATLAELHVLYDWDGDSAEIEIKRAKQLGATTMATRAETSLAAFRQQWQLASSLAQSAIAVDPLNPEPYVNLAFEVYLRDGEYGKAEEALRHTLATSPNWGSARYLLGVALLMQGKLDDALAAMKEETLGDGRNEGLALVYWAMGRKTESDEALRTAITLNGANWPSEMARIYAFRGQDKEAMSWLTRAYDYRDEDFYIIKSDPLLKGLEGNPAYAELLRNMDRKD